MRNGKSTWCIFLRSLPTGGVERQFIRLANLLSEKRRVVFVTMFEPLPSTRVMLNSDIQQIVLFPHSVEDETPLWDLIRAPFYLHGLLRRERIDVVYSAREVANLVAACACFARKGVRLLWGHRVSNHRFSHRIRMLLPFSRMLQRRVYCQVANSEDGLGFYRSLGLCRGKVARIVNFLDNSIFRIAPQLRAARRGEWKLTNDAIAIGIVGRIAAMKNQDGFLKLAGRVAPDYPDAKFLVIGPMNEQEEQALRAKARDSGLSGQLSLIPGVPMKDMPAVFNALDVLCSTSLFGEGFCNTMAEAMACGCAVVGTDVGAAKEIVGSVGELVPPGDDRIYEVALRRMLDGLAASSATARRFHILSICDDDVTMARILELGEA